MKKIAIFIRIQRWQLWGYLVEMLLDAFTVIFFRNQITFIQVQKDMQAKGTSVQEMLSL